MSRTVLTIGSALLVAAAQPSASGFTGTWVADLDSQSGLGKDVYLVAGGTYTCASCTPSRTYAADGKPHAIPGDAEASTESVTIVDPRTIITHIVEPGIARTTTMTVARDNRTATYVSIDHRPGIRHPLKTVYVARRVSSGPPGSHLVSGTWQGVRYVSVPELIRTTLLSVTRNRFTYRVPTGVTYSATFGGPFVRVMGPYKEPVFAAVKRIGGRQIVETRKQNGKVVQMRTFKLSPDGRSMTMSTANPATKATFVITAHRK